MTKANDENRGFLISFEGSEGSGKSTQAEIIADKFEEIGYDILVTREPGGTEIGEQIRHILMYADEGKHMCPETELLLFAASRAQLVREQIMPALDEGKVVICDRFLDSTTVYQGVGRQISAEPVQMINQFAVGDVIPDVTVVVDVPAELGFERIKKHRNHDMSDRMESENIEFYKKVRQGYIVLAKTRPERFIVIDGTKSKEEVADEIWKQLRERVI